MIQASDHAAAIRRKIEALGTSLSLPATRKALGLLEGEHASNKRSGGADDVMDIREYTPYDESRSIDWKTSARSGKPMVVQRERQVTSRVWLLLDVGIEMTGSCPNGERVYEVAANALRMFATLSLKRSDDISLVLADAANITRVPFHGGFSQFERTLDKALEREWIQPRNIDALLSYARRITERNALIVLATDEHALEERHITEIRHIAQSHPVVLVDVATANPFKSHAAITLHDGVTGRRIPAFFQYAPAAQEIDTHREYVASALQQELTRCGSTMIRSHSSEGMFARFLQLLSLSQAHRSPRRAQNALVSHAV